MRRLAVTLALLLVVAGCGDDDSGGSGAGVSAVATTTQVADLVRNVGGDRVDVDGILPPNADPHDYEPRPSDAAALADADVVFRSGGDLDGWLDELIDSAGGDAGEVTLMDSVETIEGDHGVDPHWWQDPRNAILAVAAIRDALIRADPGGRDGYERRAAAYTRRLRALDARIAGCIARVPAAERKLVTTHDALGYYARRYGLEVIGTVIPSLSTQGQASPGELAELAQTIRDEKVKVVFAESSVNSKVERAIADEAGARVGRALWADTLGPEGSDGATYLQSIAANTEAMVDGVTGGAVGCEVPG
jgi:ABC-type Zn uptake system ZnuABC Zn-binding protein ZnuA